MQFYALKLQYLCNTNSFGILYSAEQALHDLIYHISFQNNSNCLISKNNIISTKKKKSCFIIDFMNHIHYEQESFNSNI